MSTVFSSFSLKSKTFCSARWICRGRRWKELVASALWRLKSDSKNTFTASRPNSFLPDKGGRSNKYCDVMAFFSTSKNLVCMEEQCCTWTIAIRCFKVDECFNLQDLLKRHSGRSSYFIQLNSIINVDTLKFRIMDIYWYGNMKDTYALIPHRPQQ